MARAAIKIVRTSHQAIKEAYGRSMQMNLTPPSMEQDFPLLQDGSNYNFAFPTPGSTDGTGSSVYDIAAADQALFERSAMLVSQTGSIEFDDACWMGYRHMVANDATDALDDQGDM
ncbi:hypothetical protein IFR05_012068 [Cadophora sp. M221]|nr:hypothetical protein IFR05_012068 [Cadophora sp. M221]